VAWVVVADPGGESGRPLLSVRGVSLSFGSIIALDDISFDVEGGQIRGLIGPNGAGKTTLFNCLSRLYDVDRGAIDLEGRSLLAQPRHAIARAGIGRTFQNLALFDTMSVLDNVLVGRHGCSRGGFLVDTLRLPRAGREERRSCDRVLGLLERFDLTAAAREPVGGLPFAVKKRVELARALAGEPKLLLLDEPAGGLNHEEVERLGDLIRALRDDLGLAILLVEHHLNLVMRVSDRVVALDFGHVIAEGTPAEMQRNPEVVRAYLGVSA
jgi:branched-chain amino acid transport system ATP-binding protein